MRKIIINLLSLIIFSTLISALNISDSNFTYNMDDDFVTGTGIGLQMIDYNLIHNLTMVATGFICGGTGWINESCDLNTGRGLSTGTWNKDAYCFSLGLKGISPGLNDILFLAQGGYAKIQSTGSTMKVAHWDGGWKPDQTCSISIGNDAWSQYIVSYDGTTLKQYVNGTQCFSGAYAPSQQSRGFQISQAPADNWETEIDELNVYVEECSTDDVARLWGNFSAKVQFPYPGVAPPSAPTFSTYNYTNDNIKSGENRQTWDESINNELNITSDDASFTFLSDITSDVACGLDVNQNFDQFNDSYHLSTTNTTIHSLTTSFDSISNGNHFFCCSGKSTLGAQSSTNVCTVKLNITRVILPTGEASIQILQNGINETRKYELETTVNLTLNTNLSSNYILCVDIDDPNYGDNYTCSTDVPLMLNYSQSNITINTFESDASSVTLNNVNSEFDRNSTYDLTINTLPQIDSIFFENRWITIEALNNGTYVANQWTGSTWEENATLVTGLSITGYPHVAMAFNITGTSDYEMIISKSDGSTFGYYWTGTQWFTRSGLVNGLPSDLGSNTGISITKNILGNNEFNLIANTDDTSWLGYVFSDSSWRRSLDLVEGLDDRTDLVGSSIGFNMFGNNRHTLISTALETDPYYLYNFINSSWVRRIDLDSSLNNQKIGDDYGTTIMENLTGLNTLPVVLLYDWSATTSEAYTFSQDRQYKVTLNYSQISNNILHRFKLNGLSDNLANISIDILDDNTIDIILPGNLTDSKVISNGFTNNLKSENLSFTTSGSQTRYLNLSTSNIDLFNDGNLTLSLSGFTIDTETVNFEEDFVNDSFIESTNGSASNYVYEDASAGNFNSRWSGDITIVSNSYIQGLTNENGGGGTCETILSNPSKWTTSSSSDFIETTDNDLKQHRKIYLDYSLFTSASCNAIPCGQSTSASANSVIGIKDSDGNFNSISGISSSASCTFSSNSDSDSEILDTEIEFRDDGFVYVDGTQKFSYTTDKQYYFYGQTAGTSRGLSTGGQGIVRFNSINFSGYTGEYYQNLTFNKDLVNLVSEPITTVTNITRATLTTTKSNIDGGTETLYISNNNGADWVQAISGSIIPFTSIGNELKVNITLNITDNQSNIVIDRYSLVVTPGTIENLSIDLGNDGVSDYTFEGLINESNSPQNVTMLPNGIKDYLSSSSCTELTCTMPVVFRSEKAGSLQYEDITYIQNVTEIVLSNDTIEHYLMDDCDDECNLTVSFYSKSNTSITIDNLVNTYIGDGEVSLTGYVYNLSFSLLNSLTSSVIWRYSPFDLQFPDDIEYYDIFPSSYDAKNVEPYGQTTTIPILNYTNRAKTDPVDIFVCLNETLDPCLNITWTNFHNQSNGDDIASTYNCTSVINITNGLLPGESVNIFNFWNLTDCSTNAFRFLDYNYISSSWCSDCVEVN